MNFGKKLLMLAAIAIAANLAACGGSSNQTVSIPKVVSIALSPATATVGVGGTETLSVTGTYNTGGTTQIADSGVTFTSSNAKVATVNAAGVVTAVSPGTANVTASDSSLGISSSQAAVVTVQAPKLTSIALSPLSVTLMPGATEQLTVVGTYNNGSTANLAASGEQFQSLNSGIATVSASGLVTVSSSATSGQTATIVATDTASGLSTSTSDSTVVTVGAPSATTTAVLSTGFNSNGTTTTSTSATGKWFVYDGGANSPAGGSGGGYADKGVSPSYEYVYLQDTTAKLAGYTYQGLGIQSATGQTVSTSGYSSLGFTVAVNPEWFSAGANFVVLIKANVQGVSTSSCDPQVAAVVKATASGNTAYTVPLTAFDTITQNCGNSGVTPAQILAAPIVEIDFQADGGTAAITASGLTSNTNTTIPLAGSSPAVYPTTINVVGQVAFTNATSSTSPGSGSGSGSSTTTVLSTGFNSDGTTTTSTSATGKWVVYSGGANSPSAGSGGGYADKGVSPSYEYIYIQDTAAKLAGYTYQGVGIQPASGQIVSAGNDMHLNFTLGVNNEWFSAGANFVVLIATNVNGVSTSTCNPQVAAVVSATASAATAYTIPLTAFSKITQNCGNSSVTTAQILAAPVTQIDFQADGGTAAITASGLTSNTNTTIALAGSSPAVYPTTVSVVGQVEFAP